MILILSSRRRMEAELASLDESTWVTISLETFPDESVVYWTVLVVFLDDMAEEDSAAAAIRDPDTANDLDAILCSRCVAVRRVLGHALFSSEKGGTS